MATPVASVSGIVSGLDTATLISQLMQLESAPQTQLKTKLSSEQTKLSAYQSVNAKLASLATQAAALTGATSLTPLKATSSSDKVTATASSSAAPANLTVTVNQVAVAAKAGWSPQLALTDVIGGADHSYVVRTDDGAGGWIEKTITTANGTLEEFVDAINDPANETGLTASAVNVGNGKYQLLVSATKTGANSDFQLRQSDGTSTILAGGSYTAGQDASISLGSGITATSSTNTFEDLIEGVDLTVSSASVGTTVDVTVARDTAAAAGSVKGLIDAINSMVSEIKSKSTYNTTTGSGGPLVGAYTFQTVKNDLLNTVFPPGNTSTLADYGIELDRNGNITFNESKFTEAYTNDPAALTAALGAPSTETDAGGFAARVAQVAKNASDPYDGFITSLINGQNSSIKRIQDSIESWDIRLEKREATLRAQFTAMETALSNAQAQGSWLASQLSSMSSSSS